MHPQFLTRLSHYQIPFRVLTFFLIIIDMGIVIADMIIDCPGSTVSRTLNAIDVGISLYFVLEISIRIFALTPKVRLELSF